MDHTQRSPLGGLCFLRLLELAGDLDEQVSMTMTKLVEAQEAPARLTALYPDGSCDGGWDGGA